jgi:transposase
VLVGRADPRHRESDTKVVRGRITKQGSRPLRWALVEAVQRTPAGTPIRQAKDAIIARRGIQARNIAKVAAARKLLTYVFYAMRDGHVRALAGPAAEHQAR